MPSSWCFDMTMQDSNKNAACRAYRRIAPRSFEVILLPHFVARAFCGRLIEQYAKDTEYFNPCQDWPHPMEVNACQRLLSKPLPMKISTGPTCANEAVACACVQPPKQPLLMCAAHFTEE